MLDLKYNTIIENTKNFLTDNKIISMYEDVCLPPGKEHYLLLASIGIQLQNKKIIEFGTHYGRAAYTLNYGNRLYNNNNSIITYDINNILIDKIFENTNIQFRIGDMFTNENMNKNKEELLSSDLIFIDIDPHEGVKEYEMYLWLKNNNYKGLILLDDIHLGPGHMGVTSGNSMQQFWDKIDTKYKIDLTNVGHHSGTGLVCFNFENYQIDIDV